MYRKHPDPALVDAFMRRPWQGAPPEQAEFLFVGLDVNYAADLDPSTLRSLLDYHEDGVAFWRRHGVHHPFLLDAYRGDGRKYHSSFARIGFKPEQAHRVSFVELLHLPTTGRSRLDPSDLSPDHLQGLDLAIRNGRPRQVFLSASVLGLMRRSPAFAWLPARPSCKDNGLDVLYRNGDLTIYRHLHFSTYGKFERAKQSQAAAIRRLADLE